jgi:phenylpropionate dioxygenase-like ring-hydroxylating dioxygenase large terminal subunit
MLSSSDNELVTRVGPGTLMGTLMRQYWLPAMLSSELPRPDGDPVRVLLLGEQLIGFRDSSGRVGLVSHS